MSLARPSVRRHVAGGERGERGGVELLGLAGGGDLLTVLVDQEHGARIGFLTKPLQRLFQALELLLIHDQMIEAHGASRFGRGRYSTGAQSGQNNRSYASASMRSLVPPRPPRGRGRDLERLAGTPWDLLVVGGGASGVSVALEAARRGLSVALVEQDDIASGTSSRSSRLIHGGLRYLAQGEFALVREGLRERRRLLREAPGLVRRVPFVYPVYRGDPDGLAKVDLGLWAYDFLSFGDGMGIHRRWSAARVHRQFPRLRAQGLRGALRYGDAATHDARLTLAVAIAAARAGALIATRCQVLGLDRAGEGGMELEIEDRIGRYPCHGRRREGSPGLRPVARSRRRPGPDPHRPAAPTSRSPPGGCACLPTSRCAAADDWPAGLRDALRRLHRPRHDRRRRRQPTGRCPPELRRRRLPAALGQACFSAGAHRGLGRHRPVGRPAPSARRAGHRESRPPLAPPPGARNRAGVFVLQGGKLTTHRRMAEDALDRIEAKSAPSRGPGGRCSTARWPPGAAGLRRLGPATPTSASSRAYTARARESRRSRRRESGGGARRAHPARTDRAGG
jgi:hypothetical protein